VDGRKQRRIIPAHSVLAEEFGQPAWNYQPPSGSAPTGAGCAIVGLQSCTWNAFNPSFFSSLLSFFASQGVTDASIYDAEVLGACAPAYPDNGQIAAQYPTSLQTAIAAMQNHQYSLSGASMAAILSSWNKTSLRGCSGFLGGSLIP
jgi:hypothetical protein